MTSNELEDTPLLYPTSDTLTLSEFQQSLPIFSKKRSLLYLIEHHQVLILVGETGSGKSTQLPQYLHFANWTSKGYRIAITQPRRIAALSLAKRVASELDTFNKTGYLAGYNVRFDNKTSSETRIVYMTDGILFRELLSDPLLTSYSIIIIDEAHERTIYIDLLLSILKKIMKKRPELRIVISSATPDIQTFYNYFYNKEDTRSCCVANVEGKSFEVDIYYLKEACMNYLDKTADVIMQIHYKEKKGDILVFLTGREDIEYVMEALKTEKLTNKNGVSLDVLALHSGLNLEQQEKILKKTKYNQRKVILATNIAETSLTIDNIVYVVDTGFFKTRLYDIKTETYSLVVAPISKAQAKQRSGRAGRVADGKVYRLYTEEAHESLLDKNIPDMQKADMTSIILQLKALGIGNVAKFDFVSPPPSKLFIHALEYLHSIDALDVKGNITYPLGVKLSELPLDPSIGKILLESEKYECSEEMLIICAMLSTEDIFVNSGSCSNEEFSRTVSKFATKEGDHISYINIFKLFLNNQSYKWCKQRCLNYQSLSKAIYIHEQLKSHLKALKTDVKSCNGDTVKLRKCLISGYYRNIAQYKNNEQYYVTVKDKLILYPHPTSVLFSRVPRMVLYNEVIETTKPYMRHMCAIEQEWLQEVMPNAFKIKQK